MAVGRPVCLPGPGVVANARRATSLTFSVIVAAFVLQLQPLTAWPVSHLYIYIFYSPKNDSKHTSNILRVFYIRENDSAPPFYVQVVTCFGILRLFTVLWLIIAWLWQTHSLFVYAYFWLLWAVVADALMSALWRTDWCTHSPLTRCILYTSAVQSRKKLSAELEGIIRIFCIDSSSLELCGPLWSGMGCADDPSLDEWDPRCW